MITLLGYRVFRIQGQAMQVRQHPKYRFAGALLQPVQPTLQ